MGLSNEERLLKFYNQLAWWRQGLVKLYDAVEDSGMYGSDENPKSIVRRWIGTLDCLVGRMVRSSDASGAYWILGESDGNFRGLVSNIDLLGLAEPVSADEDEGDEGEPSYGSLGWAMRYLDLPEVTKRLTAGKFRSDYPEIALRLALWWDMWHNVAATLYPVCRYDDKVFKAILDDLTKLLGEMVNLRYAVVTRGGHPSNIGIVHKLEGALLSRYRVVRHLIDVDEKKVYSELSGPRGQQRRKALMKKLNQDNYDVGKQVERVGSMTLTEIEESLKKLESDVYEFRNKSSQEEYAKEQARSDGLFGPKPRSRAELERVIDESNDIEEIRRAVAERSAIYNTFGGVADSRIEQLQKQAKKAEVKKGAAKKGKK